MAWIPSYQALARHPKTKRLARQLDVSLPAAIGHLHCLWWWAVDYAADGDLSRYTAEDVADAALWIGDPEELVAAMLGCGVEGGHGFLDRDDDGHLAIHDWMDHTGRFVQQRQAATRRTQQWRDGNAHATHSERVAYAPTVHDMTGHESTEQVVHDDRSRVEAAPQPRNRKPARVAEAETTDGEHRRMWAVLLKVLAIDAGADFPPHARARWNGAIKSFRDAGVSSDELMILGDRYERRFGSRPPTPGAILKYLPELRVDAQPTRARRSSSPKRESISDEQSHALEAAFGAPGAGAPTQASNGAAKA